LSKFKESIDESKKSIANPIKINLATILKKKTKLPEKNEEEKVQDKSLFFKFFIKLTKKLKETINLIVRQGNKVFVKEISLSNENKIATILKKKEDIEAVENTIFLLFKIKFIRMKSKQCKQ